MDLWYTISTGCALFLILIGAGTLLTFLIPFLTEAICKAREIKALSDQKPEWADDNLWERSKLKGE